MDISLSQVKHKLLPLTGTALFVLFIVMLPRYTEIAKTWYVLLILLALGYLLSDLRQLRHTTAAERLFIAAVIVNFLWIALCYYANGKPGQGDAFLWSRHFYFLFVIPLFFLFRRIEIGDRIILLAMCACVLLSLGDILIDFAKNQDHREQGMNPNAFGPIQLCLSGMLFFYFYYQPEKSLRWLALAGFSLGAVNVILSMSRTTWVTMIVMSVIVVLYLSRRQPLSKKIGVVALMTLILASSYLLPIVKNRIDQGATSVSAYFSTDNLHGTVGVRLELWKTGWKIFSENPLIGVGVGGFQVMARANSERYQVDDAVHRYKYVHNQYLASLASSGFPGLLLFLAVMVVPLYIAASRDPDSPGTQVARLSLIFIVASYLIGCLAEDHFETKSATMFTSVFFALLLARLSTPGSEAETEPIS